MRFFTIVLVPALLGGGLCFAAAPPRWIPQRCIDAAALDRSATRSGEKDADSRWNDAYRRGWRSIEDAAYVEAESAMCRALLAAREFGPRDWRYAETLDELGLIAFQLRDFELAEQVQGAAIAEMLLAVGPHGEPLRDSETSAQSPIRPGCRSGVRAYATRLGWIHERTRGRVAADALAAEPWRIFDAGYLPLDPDLAQRLDWLVSQYLLEENLAAADALSSLQDKIRGDER